MPGRTDVKARTGRADSAATGWGADRVGTATGANAPNLESRISNPGTTRIMGIDPGSQRTGIGIIDVDAGGALRHVFHDALQLLDNERFPLRLKQIFDDVCALIAEHEPQAVAIERVLMARNADSALKLGQARGAAICAAVHCGLTITEYAPKEIKQAVVGGGGAGKEQVQHMIGILLNVSQKLQADAADALAVAITHAHTQASVQRIGIPRSAWRRRR
jgi:crossover junction endodeoxyribonuclease RuvC